MPSGRNVIVADAVTALRGLETHLCNESVPTPLSAPASAPPCLRAFCWRIQDPRNQLSTKGGISLKIPQCLGWEDSTHILYFHPKLLAV